MRFIIHTVSALSRWCAFHAVTSLYWDNTHERMTTIANNMAVTGAWSLPSKHRPVDQFIQVHLVVEMFKLLAIPVDSLRLNKHSTSLYNSRAGGSIMTFNTKKSPGENCSGICISRSSDHSSSIGRSSDCSINRRSGSISSGHGSGTHGDDSLSPPETNATAGARRSEKRAVTGFAGAHLLFQDFNH